MFDDFDFEEFITGLPWPKIVIGIVLGICSLVFVTAGLGLYVQASSHESNLATLDEQISEANASLNQETEAEQQSTDLRGSTNSTVANAGTAMASAQNTMMTTALDSQTKTVRSDVLTAFNDAVSPSVVSDQDCFAWATPSSSKTTSLSWRFCTATAFDSSVSNLKVAWKLINDKETSEVATIYGWVVGEYDTQSQKFSKLTVYSTEAGRASDSIVFCDSAKSISESVTLDFLLGVA